MRILYVATVGGFMPFFKTLVKELIDAGNVVDFAANQTTSKVPDYYKEWGCKVFDISCSRSPFSLGNIKAIKEIRRLAKNYDIVHCHTPLAGMATRLACRKLRKKQNLKVIYTAHGFHFYKGAPKKNWMIYYPIEKMCSRWTDVLITINKEDYDFAKRKMRSTTVEYVPGVGLDVERFSNHSVDKERILNELGVPDSAKIVLSVGELNVNKNHEVIVKALGILKNDEIHYLIAGTGDQKDNLESLARVLKVNLHLLGYRHDVDDLYAVSDVFAFPSIREGLPISPLEAMASGLPVICLENRGTKEYSFDSSMICKTNDPVCFAKAIERVLLSNDTNAIRKNNIEMAKRFDVKIVNELMHKIYEGVEKNG